MLLGGPDGAAEDLADGIGLPPGIMGDIGIIGIMGIMGCPPAPGLAVGADTPGVSSLSVPKK